MVQQQQQTQSKSNDVSDIYALGADDAEDYGDFISQKTLDKALEEEPEKKPKGSKKAKKEEDSAGITDQEIKIAMAHMTPRQRKSLYHTNDVTDMPQHDPTGMEMTEGPEGSPYGFGIQTMFNTHDGRRNGNDYNEDYGVDPEPKVEKPWWHDAKPLVHLSAQDVINQQWNDYYRSQRYNRKAKAEGQKSDGDAGDAAEPKKEEKKSAVQVESTKELEAEAKFFSVSDDKIMRSAKAQIAASKADANVNGDGSQKWSEEVDSMQSLENDLLQAEEA